MALIMRIKGRFVPAQSSAVKLIQAFASISGFKQARRPLSSFNSASLSFNGSSSLNGIRPVRAIGSSGSCVSIFREFSTSESKGGEGLIKGYNSSNDSSNSSNSNGSSSDNGINSNNNRSGNSSNSKSKGALVDDYLRKVEKGLLIKDEYQIKILKVLSKLSTNISTAYSDKTNNNIASDNKADEAVRLRGVYLYGSVGTGKTMMMDAFFENCNIKKKRRVHFHKFMLEIHNRIHEQKQELLKRYGKERHINLNEDLNRDPIVQVAELIADEASLLCFDEFQVTDICDAMILTRLFGTLWNRGTVLVATSNRPPSELYKDGINREYFLPFIDRLQSECIVRYIASDKDYRLESSGLSQVSFVPISEVTKNQLWAKFLEIIIATKNRLENQSNIDDSVSFDNKEDLYRTERIQVLDNRYIVAPKANLDAKIAWFEFSTLCEEDRGAADYQAICKSFNIIFVHGIPKMSVLNHDRARRFIIFIDEVYDAGVRLFWTADDVSSKILQTLETRSEIEESDSDNGSGNKDNAKDNTNSTSSNSGIKNKFLGVDHSWSGSRTDCPLPKEIDNPVVVSRAAATNEKWVSSFSLPPPSTFYSIPVAKASGNSHEQNAPTQREAGASSTVAAADSHHHRGDNTNTHQVNYSVKVDHYREEELNVLQGELASIQELSFAFRRASSRLFEIGSEEYLANWKRKYGERK